MSEQPSSFPFPLIPVVTLDRAEDARPLGETLLTGGLPIAEITFRTPAAAEAIHLLRDSFPELMVGAGTILNVEQAQKAVEAGATFLVSPGLDISLLAWARKQNVRFYPGVMTPSEVMRAVNEGIHMLKFFPAEAAGGVKMLKALSGPFPQVRFIPTGGIHPGNMAAYLKHPAVLACGSSWMTPRDIILAGDFVTIRQRLQQAVVLAQSVDREGGVNYG